MAEEKFGTDHGFKLLYAPMNMLMPEVFIEKFQKNKKENQSFLKVAEDLEMNVLLTSPFCSGLTLNLPLPTHLTKINYLAGKHLNFIRSLPYKSLKSVIFEAKNNRHVKINL